MRNLVSSLILLGVSATLHAAPPASQSAAGSAANFAPPKPPAVVNDWSRDEFQFKFTFKNSDTTAWVYIPATAKKVRALFLLQENVSEQLVSVHPAIRRACDANDVAVAWCQPGFDPHFEKSPQQTHDLIQRAFGDFGKSIGYPELGDVPLITYGHSSTNAYCQHAAESKPERVLAVLATHGGNFVDAFDKYKGPVLLFIGHYWELKQQTRGIDVNKGMAPLSKVRKKLKKGWMPITVVEEYGSGHFDYSDQAVEVFGMFIDKAVKARLDKDGKLRDIDPNSGYIAAITSSPGGPIPVKPYKDGSAQEKAGAVWFFDKELAEATVKIINGNGPWNREFQMIGYNQPDGTPAPFGKSGWVSPVPYQIVPGTNAIKFFPVRLEAFPAGFPKAGQPIGVSSDPTITIEYVNGPYVYLDGDGKYRVKLNRGGSTGYLVARNLGDAKVRPAVQPASLVLGGGRGRGGGGGSVAAFNPGNQRAGANVPLKNVSPANQYVGYYANYGPARVVGDKLEILPLPANTSGPLEVELVTYTLGQGGGAASARFTVSK